MSDNYFFAEEEIKNAAIRVSIVRWRLLANVFVLVIPVVAYIMARPLLMVFDAIGDSAFPSLFRIFMILTFAIGVWLLIRNAGKEIVVSGRGIIIRKYFLFQDAITVDQVYKCEVITGLAVYSRYRTEHFSKAVIYYGENSKVSVTDNMYRGWQELVNYMHLNQKVDYIDGRSGFSKSVDDFFKRG